MNSQDCVKETDAQSAFDSSASCDACGRIGAYQVGERNLCPDCYTEAGSCCPEFGKDDLWVFVDDDPKAPADAARSVRRSP